MIQLFKKSTYYTFWISIVYEGDLCIQEAYWSFHDMIAATTALYLHYI